MADVLCRGRKTCRSGMSRDSCGESRTAHSSSGQETALGVFHYMSLSRSDRLPNSAFTRDNKSLQISMHILIRSQTSHVFELFIRPCQLVKDPGAEIVRVHGWFRSGWVFPLAINTSRSKHICTIHEADSPCNVGSSRRPSVSLTVSITMHVLSFLSL